MGRSLWHLKLLPERRVSGAEPGSHLPKQAGQEAKQEKKKGKVKMCAETSL